MPSTEGGCLCSAIRYRITGSPIYSVICHCTTCRKASGAQSLGWLTLDRQSFLWLRGAPRKHSSSPGVTRTFCDRCGTSLTYENDETASTIDITTASTDHPALFPPNQEVWLEHKIEWEVLNPKLAHYPEDISDE